MQIAIAIPSRNKSEPYGENPANKFGWEFFAWFWSAVARDKYENGSNRCVEQRKKRKERGQPAHDVMKDRQQPKVLGILIHSLTRPAILF
jgi:hypothetical protein